MKKNRKPNVGILHPTIVMVTPCRVPERAFLRSAPAGFPKKTKKKILGVVVIMNLVYFIRRNLI